MYLDFFSTSAKIFIICFCFQHCKTSSSFRLDQIILETTFLETSFNVFKVVTKHKMLE